MCLWLLFIWVVLSLAEIYTFIQIGGEIGALMTIGLIVFTALVGFSLARAQGFAVLNNIRRQINARKLPARSLWDGLLIVIAGALLIVPGFLTDTLGFLFLIPLFRLFLFRALLRRWLQRRFRRQIRVIEGEFQLMK